MYAYSVKLAMPKAIILRSVFSDSGYFWNVYLHEFVKM